MRMRDILSAVPSSAIAALGAVARVQEEGRAISFQQASPPP